MTTVKELSLLFSLVKEIIGHQEELDKLKGEKFNLFSVLKMERRENATHSALIAELLNPIGSHLKNTVFLDLFLETIGLGDHLDSKTSWVKPEFYIGELDMIKKTGGRIDIMIGDKKGNTISIENKIFASDQEAQIERYCNYQKENNKVVYLTLLGEKPSEVSCGKLQENKDFTLLSYKDGIKNWLQRCLKETAEMPILRESIKQYINLINKMTSTPDNKLEKDLTKLLVDHFDVAVYVKNNFAKARQFVGDEIRHIVRNKIEEKIGDRFEVLIGYPITNTYAQIWIKHKEKNNPQVFFGAESFNGTGNDGGKLYVGIFNTDGLENDFTKSYTGVNAKRWYEVIDIAHNGVAINFINDDLISKIINNEDDFKNEFTTHIASVIVDFVISNSDKVLKFI